MCEWLKKAKEKIADDWAQLSLDAVKAQRQVVTFEVSKAPPPAPATPPDEKGLLKRERQIRAIESECDLLKFDRHAIEKGGKTTLRQKCKEKHPLLFGGGDDPFNEAWTDASHSLPPRLRMFNHHIYAGGRG